MAIANYFYNSSIRKYVALFGTYFNQLEVRRTSTDGTLEQRQIVPIAYAPYQKVLARLDQDPGLQGGAAQDAVGNTIGGRPFAIALPRMSFELTSFTYDAERKVSPTRRVRKTTADEDGGNRRFVYSGTPYNMGFSLYIMAKYNEDAVKILEQVLPFFNPDFTSTVRMIPELEPLDIPLILNSVNSEDIYDGDFETRRSILYTLDFTMKGWFFGPEKDKKVIKFTDMRYATDTPTDTEFEEFQTLQPGVTANGTPTSDASISIDYSLVDFDDNWAPAETRSDTEPS
jgi:hypothetical protein|tara:strand:- start:1064 stop:1921 length:858 start_codon:yes stop_codon:yes gene_type:complete